MIRDLSERDAEIIRLCNDVGMNQTAVGRLFDLTGARVSQILNNADPDRTKHAGPPKKLKSTFRAGHATRKKGSTLRRFESTHVDPSDVVRLDPHHPAVVEGRTLFPSTVVSPADVPRLLVSGHNNPKLGKAITKGPRKGWPIFHLTLEERKTCPRSCPVFSDCYGNAMHMARRHDVDEHLVPRLRQEVAALAQKYPRGFLVRLHTLGDFFSAQYVLAWAQMLHDFPPLHVFGYTARATAADVESARIMAAIDMLRSAFWDRFAIRDSTDHAQPQASIVVSQALDRPDVIMCPAQTEATETCGTCGLCWSPNARDKTIAFLLHGMARRRRKSTPLAGVGRPAPEGSKPEQVAGRIAEHFDELLAKHGDELTARIVATWLGEPVYRVHRALDILRVRGVLRTHHRLDRKSMILMRPGDEPPRPELTDQQRVVFEAICAAAGSDWRAKISMHALARVTDQPYPSVQKTLIRLAAKGFIQAVDEERRGAAKSYFVTERARPDRLTPAAAPEPDPAPPTPPAGTNDKPAYREEDKRANLPATVKARPMPPVVATQGLPFVYRGAVTLEALDPRACRWPVGTKTGIEQEFCARRKAATPRNSEESTSYCLEHESVSCQRKKTASSSSDQRASA